MTPGKVFGTDARSRAGDADATASPGPASTAGGTVTTSPASTAGGTVTTSPAGGAAGAGSANLAKLEHREGGQLGVLAIDTATGHRIEHRVNERFAMCSTFKFIAAAAILQRVDRGAEHLDRRLEFTTADLLEYAPIARKHVQERGMTMAEACSAAVEWSDNTAANLILKALGGPESVTAFIRTLGDQVTRLDQTEPALNVVAPGDIRNTTTAASMVRILSTVILGRVLSTNSRATLEGWLVDFKVGDKRVPAGLPQGWTVGHKTGTWSDQTNDVGLIWPPAKAPIVYAALYHRGGIPSDKREAVLCEVGRIITTSF
jgi:beta-lactamase class A